MAMQGDSSDTSDEAEEYYVIPEDALHLLPEEWRNQIQAIAEDGRTVLKSVDAELSQISKLTNSFLTLVALKHVQKRLSEYEFSPDVDALLELDMLTTAFVVTYARLQQGGTGSGFSRDALPARYRPFHDNILELRNKRFAHNAGHHSISDAMEIGMDEGRFEIKLNMSVQFQIGGAPEWGELVSSLEALMAERLDRLVARLAEKTGREWSIPGGPAPS